MNEIIHKDISTFKEKTSLDGTEFIQVSKDEKVNLLQVIDNSIAKRLTESDSESTIPGFNFNPRSIYYRTTSNTPIILHSRNIEALRGGVTQSQVDAGEGYRRFEHKWYEDYKLGEIAFSVEDKFELLTDSFSCYFIDTDQGLTTHLLSEVWISGLISNIKIGAFSGCNKIHRFHNIWDPDTISKDGSQVFNLFEHLGETQVELVHIAPASLSKNIDPSLPMSVTSQTLTFVVDDKVTTVADLAFGYMPDDLLLKGVVFGDKVTRVGTTMGAFYQNRCVESLVYGSKVDLKEPNKPIIEGVVTIWPLSLQSISIKNSIVSGPPTATGRSIRYIVSENNFSIYSSILNNKLQNGDTIEPSPIIPETPPTHVVNSVIKYHTTDNTSVQHTFSQGYSPFWNYYGEMEASEVLAYPIEELGIYPDYSYTLGGVATVFPLFSGKEVRLGGNYFMGTFGNMGGDFCIPKRNMLILGSNASSYINFDKVLKLQTVDRLVFPASLKALTSSAITIHGLEHDVHLYFYSTYPPSYLPYNSTEISNKILEISDDSGNGRVYIHVLAGRKAKYSNAAGWMSSIHTYGNRIQIVEDLYM